MPKFGFQKSRAYLALLTDFGDKDSYVGTMKGVIYSLCDNAAIIDLTHHIAPQDVTAAAFVLNSSYTYFPPHTVFVCVVDPGVGSDREIVCMKLEDRFFIAPDNGLLSVLQNGKKIEAVRTVKNTDLWLEEISRTFHGRDIFAPVGAHLANGEEMENVGPKKRDPVKDLQLPKPLKTADGNLQGEIIYVDQFGNLITNIGAATLQTSLRGAVNNFNIKIGDVSVKGISDSYADVDEGELLALIGSSGYMEIAVNRGSAKQKLAAHRGASVMLSTG